MIFKTVAFLLLALFISLSTYAGKDKDMSTSNDETPNPHIAKYSDMGITDDEIANSIKPPRPTSVSQLIDHMRKNLNLNDIEALLVSCNNICVNGATQILSFAEKELPSLKTINFSHNRIYYWEGTTENDVFEQALKKLLLKDNFQEIVFSNNEIAQKRWFKQIKSALPEHSKKIIWESQD